MPTTLPPLPWEKPAPAPLGLRLLRAAPKIGALLLAFVVLVICTPAIILSIMAADFTLFLVASTATLWIWLTVAGLKRLRRYAASVPPAPATKNALPPMHKL